MEFFNARTDSKVTPASLKFFTIYDPSLSNGEESDNTEQILLYLPRSSDTTTLNDRMRQISVIQGMNDFSSSFNKSKDGLNYIELDNTQIIFGTFENRYSFILAINLTKVEEDDGETITYDQNLPLSYLAGLVSEGYNQFRLHNGTIESLFHSMEKEQVKAFLERWWVIWYHNFQFDLKENGFLKEYSAYYKISATKSDSDLKDAVESIHRTSSFKEFMIWNANSDGESGLIYEHFKSLHHSSRIRLLNWLNVTNYYGLSPEALLSQNIVKIDRGENGEDDNGVLSEFTYDPFKLVYNTITDVSRKTGVTAGVNYGVDSVTSGFSAITNGMSSMNRYMPWSKQTEEEPESAITAVSPALDPGAPRFLIGKISDAQITYKQFYLMFGNEEEKLHRVVIFQNADNLVVLIYEFTANELNESRFYDQMLVKLTNLHRHQLNSTATKAHFYFIGIDHNSKSIISNLPEIPNGEIDDEGDRFFLDLSKSRQQSVMIHKEMIYHFNTPEKKDNQLKERLHRTRNGWWIYNIEGQNKSVFILKKWKYSNESLRILDISTNANDVIGKEAKAWLEDFLR